MSINNNFSKGSEWRKWDLHIHSPSSIVQSYGGDGKWDEFITALEHLPPEVKVIGINDYYFIDGYEKVMGYKKQGRLSNIEKIFSVLEFRIDTFGSGNENNLQKINLHIIFDINETELNNDIMRIKKEFIERIPITKLDIHKTKYLSKENFIVEGKGNLQDGFSSLIPPTDIVFELLNSPVWKDKSLLILGYKEWSNLEKNNQLKPLKDDLYQKVNAFFTSNCDSYSRSKTWLNEYGEKALLHSCDIHSFDVLDTAKKEEPSKYCCNTWIKADPTFEGLKQIIYEPINRVFIGSERPDSHRVNCINSITIEKDWFPQKTLPLNNGLVSIVGARGSGKTALLDFIALGARAYRKSKASFLNKAKEVVQPLTAKINFDTNDNSQEFIPDARFSDPLVQYLSQQFVEDLCSEDGSTERLQAEIERFIFESLDNVECMGTRNFSELRDILCKSPEITINTYKNRISDLNKKISQIHNMKTVDLPIKEKERNNMNTELIFLQSKLPKLDKSIQNDSLKEYETTNIQKIKLENELTIAYQQINKLEQIYVELSDFNKNIYDKNQYFKDELYRLSVDEKILKYFDSQYYNLAIKDINEILNLKKKAYSIKYGNEISPSEGTYKYLLQKLINIQQKMEEYTGKEKTYFDISNKIEQKKAALVEIENQIKTIKELSIENLQKERLELYKEIFEEIKKKKNILESIYTPLIQQLKKNKQEKQLGFFVNITVDIEKWVIQGEKLIDLRRAKEFRDNENLFHRTNSKLYNLWVDCDSENIKKAIDSFTNNEARLMRDYLINPSSLISLADWLFSTDHISISYEMTFNEIPLKLLSPGTKGILLMLLYLGVDKNDTRPLLIDQPEDNLDPESVYSVLVPYFTEAKKRRQIIMVTHNPNLVVATDSDQVIIADCKTEEIGCLPTFTYFGGGLENPEIVTKVCSILEGGKEAFRKREERYFDNRGE
jgi:predicted ATPase